MHEIITVQIGNQANYVGTHFWNAQESYFTYSDQDESPVNHDIHFRSGVGADGSDTYTPRTLIYDFKANFGALRRINELYDVFGEQAEETAWTGVTSTHRQPAVTPSSYQQSLNAGDEPPVPTLDTVRYWSDYSRTFFHPRSLVQIYDSELPPSDRAFASWHAGVELYEQLSKDDDLIERDLRPFAEECDQMQGLQMFMESESGWAAFGSRYLEGVSDEYGKMPVWVFGLEGTRSGGDEITARTTRLLNHARTIQHTSPQSTLYIPLSTTASMPPDYLTTSSHPWHTSALQGTAIETALLPTRLKATATTPVTTLDHLALTLSANEDRHIARLAFDVENSLRRPGLTNGHATTASDADARMPLRDRGELPLHREEKQYIDLFPLSMTQRGSRPPNPDSENDHGFSRIELQRGSAHSAPSQNEDRRGRTMTLQTPLRFNLPTSFPRIYSLAPNAHSEGSESCSINTTICTAKSIGEWVRGFERVTARAGIEEREELIEALRGVAEGFVESYVDGDDDMNGGGDEYD